jgi:hypothetical protein
MSRGQAPVIGLLEIAGGVGVLTPVDLAIFGRWPRWGALRPLKRKPEEPNPKGRSPGSAGVAVEL